MFGYVYDDIMQQHANPYDPNGKTQERPERTVLIHSRLQNDGLLKDAINVCYHKGFSNPVINTILKLKKSSTLSINRYSNLIHTFNKFFNFYFS